MVELEIRTADRDQFVDVTAQVAGAVVRLGIVTGTVLVFNPHTTAGVTINEGADPDVVRDMLGAFDRMVPWQDGYRHAEGNAAAHIKATLVGSSVLVPVRNGTLKLGDWQSVWFCEFDGPRRRRLWVSQVGQGT
ncbi:MAG: secondary thiamine-phosphate synthase enzyme YjbQ [Candidatus Krumholzibacteriia bacterium]